MNIWDRLVGALLLIVIIAGLIALVVQALSPTLTLIKKDWE